MLSPNEALDTPDAPKKMAGSLMIFEASTYAEVKAMIESDVYWTGNVVRTPPRVYEPLALDTRCSGTRRRRSSRPGCRPSRSSNGGAADEEYVQREIPLEKSVAQCMIVHLSASNCTSSSSLARRRNAARVSTQEGEVTESI